MGLWLTLNQREKEDFGFIQVHTQSMQRVSLRSHYLKTAQRMHKEQKGLEDHSQFGHLS